MLEGPPGAGESAMRLIELTTQATVGFSPTSKTRLAAGYNRLRSPSGRTAPLAELLSALFYSDGRGGDGVLAAAPGACVLVVFQGANGTLYRLVRQLGKRSVLQQLDGPGQPWREICQDARDITSVLRSSCAMPTKGQFESIFCFSPKFTPPTMERERGSAAMPDARFGFGGAASKGSGFGAPGQQSLAMRGPNVMPAQGFALQGGQERRLSSPGRVLPSQAAALPPPLPPEEAAAIRAKLQAEIAAGKALDAWQFELEGLQQKLFQHRERLSARQQLADQVASCEAEVNALGPSPEERGFDPLMLSRAVNHGAALKRRDNGVRDLKDAARKLQEQLGTLRVQPPWMRPPLVAAALAGLACLIAGLAFHGTPFGFISLLSIVAFGYPAFCSLGWLDEIELKRGIEQRAQRLKDDEQKLISDFERDYGLIEGMLRELGMASGQEIVSDRQKREALCEALASAREALARFEADPAFQQCRQEMDTGEAAVAELEKKIEAAALQVTRDHHVAESELKALEARQNQTNIAQPMVSNVENAGVPSVSVVDDGALPSVFGVDERIPALLKLALDLWPGMKIESIGGALRERISQYWTALTGRHDRRLEFNAKAELSVLGTGGEPLSLAGDDDRECLYWSVRLALLEKLVAMRPIPLLLEAPGERWPAPRLQLLARACAHLGQTTQVIHVVPSGEPIAAGGLTL